MSLAEMLTTLLPMNRKERFFTGTVFPMIVCCDGFRHFGRFTSLLVGFPVQDVVASGSYTNIQFFTEYSLVESVFGKSKGRFPNPPATKDTPDIIILIEGKKRILIALEAKMYHKPTANDLYQQMLAQSKILDYLRTRLELDTDYVYHYALLPAKLASRFRSFTFPILTWETLYDAYKDVSDAGYFLEMLLLALTDYDDLVSKNVSRSGQNAAGKLTGDQIYTGYKKNTLEFNCMGRKRGLDGPEVTSDLQSGSWRTQDYEVNNHCILPKRNWFLVADFVARIDSVEK